jgi:hypothetical protein
MNNAIAQFFPKCSESLQLHINAAKQPSQANLLNRGRNAGIPTNQLQTFATLKNVENCGRFVEVSVFVHSLQLYVII